MHSIPLIFFTCTRQYKKYLGIFIGSVHFVCMCVCVCVCVCVNYNGSSFCFEVYFSHFFKKIS